MSSGYPQSPPELRQELIAEQFVRGQSDPELKKYLWVVIRTQKDRKLQTLIEVCTDFSSLMAPSQIHRPAEQTFTVHQEVESNPEDEGELEDMFAWVTIPRGITENLRNCPPHRHYNRCLHWQVGWDTRCVLSPDRQMAIDQTQVTGRFRTKIVDSALRRAPVGTTRESNVSAVASLDTCECVVHNRTHPCRSERRVGNSSPTIINKGMAINSRETLHRQGPHPLRSVFTSSRPHVIIMHQHKFIPLTAGYFIQSYSTTSEFMYGNMFVNCGSGSCRTTGDTCKRCYIENTVDSDSSSEYFITSRQDRTGDTPGRPVSELVTISGGPPEEEAVMQISGAGHWFLEGWIGDHAVDFLVDSGSAVTAVSTSFYKSLREVGAPVGEIRATNRRLRGANGSRIDPLAVLRIQNRSSSLYHSHCRWPVDATKWTAGGFDCLLGEYRPGSGPDTR